MQAISSGALEELRAWLIASTRSSRRVRKRHLLMILNALFVEIKERGPIASIQFATFAPRCNIAPVSRLRAGLRELSLLGWVHLVYVDSSRAELTMSLPHTLPDEEWAALLPGWERTGTED